jgi:16S rRNA (cytosine1402-N4)-methyltransferase
MTSIHLPVLLEPILCEWLDSLVSAVDRGPLTIVDGTLGGGGHSLQIARRLKEGDTLIGIDRDPLPIERFIKSAPSATDHTGLSPAVDVSSEERWVEYSAVLPSGCRLVLSCASYCALPEILKEIGLSQVHGILLDLGLSSDQLDDSQRGFSFRLDAPLDLRFNPNLGISASDWLLKHSEQQIADAIYQYGEERFSRRIARAIVERNRTDPITTSKELADLLHRVIPGRIHGRVDSATRTFQALRIAVNRELEHVQRAMELMPALLATDGLLAVISFHSLEDRIVKHAMRDDPRLEVVTKKPIVATDAEVDENPRSRSAKLRIARRASEDGR